MRRSENTTLSFSRSQATLAIRERAITAPLAGGPSVSGAHPTPGKEGDMRRITALILVLATTALAAAFPLVASANHGPPHGGSPTRAM